MRLHRWFIKGVFLFTAASVGTLVACSSDDSSPSTSSSSSSSGSSATEETVTVHVSAANGGTVADKAGRAKLDIPPGALDKDTDITLTIRPKSGNAVGDVADFGPDGLVFAKPATLELKADATLAPDGKSLAVAIGANGSFSALPGSTYANGVAKANVEHFTQFSIVVVDGKVTLIDPSSCQEARSNFVPCGGDPKGTWTFADFCPDPATATVPDPFKGKCANYVGGVSVTATQEITIDATTTTTSAGQTTLTFTGDFPVSCLSEASDGGITTCDGMSNDSGTVCTDKGGGQCHCESTQVEQKPAEAPKTYSTNGTTWTGSGGSTGEYCVSGDILYYRENKDGGSPLLYVLKRK